MKKTAKKATKKPAKAAAKPAAAPKASTKELSSNQLLTGILSYLGLLVIIPILVVKERDEYISFHLRQGLALLAIEIVLWIAGVIFWGPISAIISLLQLVIFIVSLVALFQAVVNKDKWKVPYLDSIVKLMPEMR